MLTHRAIAICVGSIDLKFRNSGVSAIFEVSEISALGSGVVQGYDRGKSSVLGYVGCVRLTSPSKSPLSLYPEHLAGR